MGRQVLHRFAVAPQRFDIAPKGGVQPFLVPIQAYEEKRKALKSQKNRPLTWTCYAQGALAVLDGDEAALDTALRQRQPCFLSQGKPSLGRGSVRPL